jgi:hypothetical protein
MVWIESVLGLWTFLDAQAMWASRGLFQPEPSIVLIAWKALVTYVTRSPCSPFAAVLSEFTTLQSLLNDE